MEKKLQKAEVDKRKERRKNTPQTAVAVQVRRAAEKSTKVPQKGKNPLLAQMRLLSAALPSAGGLLETCR